MKEKKKESANDYCFVLLMSEMRDRYTKFSNAKIESNQFIFEGGSSNQHKEFIQELHKHNIMFTWSGRNYLNK